MLVTLNVTQEIIDHSRGLSPALSTNCPVALAVNKVLDPTYHAGVGFTCINIFHDTDKFVWGSDKLNQLDQYVKGYDNSRLVDEVVQGPVTIEVDIPQQYLRGA